MPALLVAPVAYGDISLGQPVSTPVVAGHGVYHTDLLSSNAVLAVFKEIRTVPVVRLESDAAITEQIAVFEVKQNLAHRRYDRMGDSALQPGRLFPVALAGDVPGQDASLAEKIRSMKPGDEAVMNIDHIYVFREEGNENVRACTRFAKRGAAPAQQQAPAQPASAAAPAAPTPQPSLSTPTPAPAALSTPSAQPAPATPGFHANYSARSVQTRITMEPDGNGGLRRRKVEIQSEWTPNGEVVRKFINDVEVDPATDQPLAKPEPSLPAAQPAPAADTDTAPASVPATPLAPATPSAPETPQNEPAAPAQPAPAAEQEPPLPEPPAM